MNVTYVPDPDKADGQLGTGSNLVPIPESNVLITYVPNPNAADGRGVSVDGIFSYDGDPNGNVMATGAAILLGEGSTAGALWVKVTSGTSSNDWIQMLGTAPIRITA